MSRCSDALLYGDEERTLHEVSFIALAEHSVEIIRLI